jgi:hypothetical protein
MACLKNKGLREGRAMWGGKLCAGAYNFMRFNPLAFSAVIFANEQFDQALPQ